MKRSSPMKRTRMRRRSLKADARAGRLAALKGDIMSRCGGRCEHPLCRKRTRLDLHHVVKRSQLEPEKADTPDNVVAICRQHHDMVDIPADVLLDMGPGQAPVELRRELTISPCGNEEFIFSQVLSEPPYHTHVAYSRPR